jgi:uncharacterized membrane protein YhaH (DUF805 family)
VSIAISKVTTAFSQAHPAYCQARTIGGIVANNAEEDIAMDIQTAVRTVLGKYATFTGRASRSEYWWWFLAMLLFNLFLRVIDGAVFGVEAFDGQTGGPLAMVAALALLLPNLAVAVRRLHDTDRSGWWILILLIPIIGYLIFLYWLVQPSHEGENRFDEPSE